MPATSKKTPKRIAAARAAREAGKGLRESADLAGVSHETLRRWEKKRKKRTPPDTARAAVVAEAAAVVSAPLPALDGPEALANVRGRLALVGSLLDRLAGPVLDEEYPATSFVTLMKYADDCARLVAELTPAPPKNPDEDPDVLEAEKVLVSRVESLVSAAEERRPTCATCGWRKP